MARNGAIVTVAASGVGLTLTKHLLGKGWQVVMTDINKGGENIAKELGSDVLWVHTNIADWDSQSNMFQKEITFLAGHAGVITNMMAPYGIMAIEADDTPRKPSLLPLDVNLVGTIYNIKLFLHVQKHKPSSPTDGSPNARIVITSSQGGLYALPSDPIYCASKDGLVGLTRPLGPGYFQNFGITVNSINPGYMKTSLVAPLIPITPDIYETTMATVMRTFDELLSSNKNGQVVEASGPNLYDTKQQAYPDEIARWMWEDGPAFWAGEMAKLGSK